MRIPLTRELEPFYRRLPIFDGYPYLVTRFVGALRHVTLLPADRSEQELRRLAELQVRANRLETCLVIGEDRAVFYDAEGSPSRVVEAPRGGALVAGKLQAAESFPPTPELVARAERLRAYIDSLNLTGYVVGESDSAYRPATAEELARLSGRAADGAPFGLVRCNACAEYRGECLGTAEQFAKSITRVYCRCENHNRCALCGGHLAEWRLGACLYDRRDGCIWFEPNFSGMSHKCADLTERVQ